MEAIKVIFTFSLAMGCLTRENFQLGSTAIGIQTADGVVLAVEKRISSILLEASSIEKIMEIDTHIGCAMSGLTADAKMMIENARVDTQVSENDLL